jgi:hypothetical protein
MQKEAQSMLEYYRKAGQLTDPGEYAALFNELPHDLPQLCRAVQGLMVHIFWAKRYGLDLSEARQQEVNLRTVPQKVRRMLELDNHPLTTPRTLEKKLVGNCRDFTLLLTAALQQQGIPARSRCGFGRYFLPDHYEDHWVCEYWNAVQDRWVMVDGQLDAFQVKTLGIRFDPLDVPHDEFVIAGKAWQLCRAGKEDPQKFGILDMHGLWFVVGDLIRDFLALNKIEILPWDPWGLMSRKDPTSPEELALLDEIAAWAVQPDEYYSQIRKFFEEDARIQPSPGWTP